MNQGKYIFSQLTELLPRITFGIIGSKSSVGFKCPFML